STAYSSTSSALARSRFGWDVARGATSHRAFTLAARHLIRVAAAPVDELLDVLDVELDGHSQVLHLGLERLGADAVEVVLERLALGAVTLVHADPSLDGVRD